MRALKDDGILSKEEFFILMEKSMLALYARGAVTTELVKSRTITSVINAAENLVAKDIAGVKSVEGDVIDSS